MYALLGYGRCVAAQAVPRFANMSVPSWLWGNDVRTFLNEQLSLRAVVHENDRWRVQTRESYLRQAPGLVRVLDIAGPGTTSPRFDRLGQFNPQEPRPTMDANDVQRAVDRASRAAEEGGLVNMFTLARLQTQLCAVSQLPEIVADAYEAIRSVGVEGTGEPVFTNASVHLVIADVTAARRARFPAILLRVAHDRDLEAGSTAVVTQLNAAGEEVFASSSGLAN
jgi:hypothetical protein